MTITLSPEVEQMLIREAAKLGTTPEALMNEILRAKYGGQQETPDERRARVHALKGSMAYLGPSRILEDRAEDRVREERRWQK